MLTVATGKQVSDVMHLPAFGTLHHFVSKVQSWLEWPGTLQHAVSAALSCWKEPTYSFRTDSVCCCCFDVSL